MSVLRISVNVIDLYFYEFDIDDKFIKDMSNVESSNSVLINELNRIRIENNYHKGFVSDAYRKLAKFYCLKDIEMISRIVSNSSIWIQHEYRRLRKNDKWIKCKTTSLYIQRHLPKLYDIVNA